MGAPLGQLNPIKNETYNLLGDLYKDLDAYFPWNMTHLGCDEVVSACWNNTDINDFMAKLNITGFDGYFNYFMSRQREAINTNQT